VTQTRLLSTEKSKPTQNLEKKGTIRQITADQKGSRINMLLLPALYIGAKDWKSVPKILDLPRLATGSERPQLAAADHSENLAGFPGC
jgi:hypothetical protein